MRSECADPLQEVNSPRLRGLRSDAGGKLDGRVARFGFWFLVAGNNERSKDFGQIVRARNGERIACFVKGAVKDCVDRKRNRLLLLGEPRLA